MSKSSQKKQSSGRYYSEPTKRALYLKSGNRCAYPGCTAQLLGQNGAYIGNICHIWSLNNTELRYSKDISFEDLNAESNLILLCSNHHKIIDSPESGHAYTAEILIKMKKEFEEEMRLSQQSKDLEKKRALHRIIISLINGFKDKSQNDFADFTLMDIEEKIDYNGIERYKCQIEDRIRYSGTLERTYQTLATQGGANVDVIIGIVQRAYSDVLKKGHSPLNADDIIEGIINRISDDYAESVWLKDLDADSVLFSIETIIFDTFVRCKILKKRPNAY